MTAAADIAGRAARDGLEVLGIAPVRPGDGLPDHVRSLVLLGPDEPGFWPLFKDSDEARDGAADPLDRWSRRVIGRIACAVGGKARFPFGGPPFQPFLDWAVRSGSFWPSPVGLLVHETRGLEASFRGAIGIAEAIAPRRGTRPCDTCAAQPCLEACPAGALGADGYDVPACRDWLSAVAGAPCRTGGCLVRRACPVGAGRRAAAQAAFHMEAFAGK